jgi:signal transduction histidine kinase
MWGSGNLLSRVVGALSPGQGWWADLVKMVAVAIIYYLTGTLGLSLARVTSSSTQVWPPTGIAIAAFLLLGSRVWPAIFVPAFLVNMSITGDIPSSLSIALGNTLEGLVASWLVCRFANGIHAFDSPLDVVKFAGLAAIASTMISATIGVASLYVTGLVKWALVGPTWLVWWLGDDGGALIVAPLLILWGVTPTVRWSKKLLLEAIGVLAALGLTSLVVFGGFLEPSVLHYPIHYITMPVLIWVAFRFGPREVATVIFLLAAVAVWGTIHGFGPFVEASPDVSLLLLQTFMGVSSVVSMCLAAAVLERRRAEAVLLATQERLHLSEAGRLIQEQHRADDAEAARDQLREFMGMVVHDLRGPLTVTTGYIQLIRRRLDQSRNADLVLVLDKVDNSVRTMTRLVSDLLDSTRIGGGRFVVRPTTLDLAEVVRQVVDEQRAVDPDHLYVVETPDQLRGEWDHARTRQVLTNLLSNAAKYSSARTEVRVHARLIEDRVTLSVADQGYGITPDDVQRLFQPFSRLGQQAQATGTGLGLYITKGIVDAHDGRIWVESSVGRGTTFYVELPLHPIREHSSDPAACPDFSRRGR